MPNESITVVYKVTDQFSATVKTMQATARAFTKDLDSLQSKLNTLNKTKISLQLDTDKAKKGLLEVQKQFSSTSGVLERLVKNGNRLNFDSIQQSLASVTKEAAGAEKQISKAMNAIGTKGNGTNDKFFSTFTEGMLKTGSAQIVGQMAQEWMTSIVGSAMGTEGKTLISSVVPAIISGMMLGNMVPLIGPFIGAVAGAGVGVLSGMAANNQSRDDAYKAWYKGLYEDAGGVTDASLTAGGVLASARERDRISFATLFGDEGTAEGYLKSLDRKSVV